MSAIVKSNFAQIGRVAIALLLMQPFVMSSEAFAQSIVPTQGVGNLGTQVSPDANNAQQLNITGGTQAAANLYHSFQQFGLTQGEIANFMSNPSIQNILARVSGGNASVINGLIQVTGGNSNLYLLNPAGIIFGANSSLNVPAAFTATTANGIQVGNGWFGVNTGIDDVKKLTGIPQAFGFASSTSIVASEQPVAAIANAGNLTAKEGQSITLVGGLVINTGTISTESGKITIAAVPDGKYVKITPEGSLLSLQLPIADQNQLAQSNVQAKDLPNLLTGSASLRNITGLNVDSSGNVLVSGTVIPKTAGTAIASGNLDVSSNTNKGGEINVLGDRVGLVSANLNASGAIGGGTVLIGGDYLGEGTVPNSQITFVDQASIIKADALRSGNGGKVIVWADNKTSFSGKILARGGIDSGNGGFIETSGKNYLNVQNASVDASAINGNAGNWLLDPFNIIVANGGLATLLEVSNGADITNTFTIDPATIANALANVTLVASNNVTFNDDVFFNNNGVGLTVTAGNTLTVSSGVSVSTNNGAISFTAGNMNIAGRLNNNGGDPLVSLNATGNIAIASQGNNFFVLAIEASNVSITSTNGNISTGSIKSISATGSNVSLTANNGEILLDGFIQAGTANGATNDGKITITAQRFTAINPLTSNANFVNVGDATGFVNNGQQNPTSLIAYAAFTNDPAGVFTGVPARSVQLQLPGDTAPRTIAGSGIPIISINILKDTTFSVYPRAILSGTSGTNGAISQGVSSIPPNVLVLLSDQSFSSNSNVVANALNGGLNGEAIATARTADLQANAGDVQECEPTGTKKPLLTITASLPSVPTRAAQSSTASKLPPCKE
ncbi:two-partner secretion domain-containing protein [Phormidium tenue]|uniref:Filamentous hemagglutinin N-terminal domain-containing protein n=1 Tax=Phormidium tenue FACHB-1050 TaxID=2692857 RepID=A0ABR8C5C7_9CYAN|nr:filamentous hemagglutinin N-terminal domain-containing protein [Phormidium tenue]MBD2315964.1 filamentous hemagglutinin N-terminal domain-containing protein [Phormidium tenue FACHB-1050]